MQRYFADIIDGFVTLNDEDIFHCVKVMRYQEGQQIEVVASEQLFLAEITSIKPFRCKVIKKIKENNELKNDIVLIFAPIKGDRFDFVLQKATELGVEEIVLLDTSRTVKEVTKANLSLKLERYQKILKEAAEQSKRTRIPLLYRAIKINELDDIKAEIKLIAYEGAKGKTTSFNKELKKIKEGDRIAIVVGPEGGFSDEEIETANRLGYKNISLGKRILRAETASIYALSVIGSYLERK